MRTSGLSSFGLASLAAEGRQIFSSIVPPEPRAAGTRLFRQGTAPEHVYWIDRGLVKIISTDRAGHEQIFALRGAGWILGAASVIVQRPYPVTAVTLTDCWLNRLPAELFLDRAQTDPQFTWLVAQTHSREIYDQVGQIMGLGSLTARLRLERFLLQWVSSLASGEQGKSGRVNLPLTRVEIAQLLAITPEHLSRVLNVMEQEGIIRRDKGTILIPDIARLQR